MISSDGLPCGLDGSPRLDDPSTIGLVLFISPLLFFFAFALALASFCSFLLYLAVSICGRHKVSGSQVRCHGSKCVVVEWF